MAGARNRRKGRGRAARVFVAVLVGMTGLAGTTAPASAAGSWKVGASVNPVAPPSEGWHAVACPTASVCLAVGSGDHVANAQRWNGTAWSLVPIATPPNTSPRFRGIACSSVSSCFAVGSNLMERWNGTSWSLVSAPKPAAATVASLTDVACPSATFCLATGSYDNNGTAQAYSARWNGTNWSIVATATPAGSLGVTLSGLSCVGPANCSAVGEYIPASGADQTLIEHWNGSSWSIVASPTPAGVQEARLEDVSCPSATFCFAVGYYSYTTYTPNDSNRPFGLRWNGSTWTIVTTGIESGHRLNFLTDVSCVSSTFCFTVGNTYPYGGASKPWVKGYNGTSWTTIAAPGFGGAGFLLSVACTSTAACFAVGVDDAVNPEVDVVTLGLVDRWDGASWKISTPPLGGSQSSLRSVSCVSATFCMAVGGLANGAEAPLAERWNGAHWSVITAPIPAGATSGNFRGVSCTSTTNCFAVGRVTTDDQSYRNHPLIERWNGTGWAIIPSPPTHTNEGALSSVSCPIASRCFAVGSTSQNYSLTEHWDGSSWTINAGGTNDLGYLSSVSCATSTRCFAVGTTFDFARTLARRWDGTTWSTVPTPDSGNDSRFYGVSCSAPGACTAVGVGRPDPDSGSRPLIERWNGSTWSISPNPALSSFLYGVSCAGSTSCVAVGPGLIEEWHGSAWTVSASPSIPGAGYAPLFGVDALSSTNYFAVGQFHTTNFRFAFTLVEQNF